DADRRRGQARIGPNQEHSGWFSPPAGPSGSRLAVLDLLDLFVDFVEPRLRAGLDTGQIGVFTGGGRRRGLFAGLRLFTPGGLLVPSFNQRTLALAHRMCWSWSGQALRFSPAAVSERRRLNFRALHRPEFSL